MFDFIYIYYFVTLTTLSKSTIWSHSIYPTLVSFGRALLEDGIFLPFPLLISSFLPFSILYFYTHFHQSAVIMLIKELKDQPKKLGEIGCVNIFLQSSYISDF